MAPVCSRTLIRLIFAASAVRAVTALGAMGRGGHRHRRSHGRERAEEHGRGTDVAWHGGKGHTKDDDNYISETARKLEYQVRLRAKDMKWSQDSLIKCLGRHDPNMDKAESVQLCLTINQERCEPGRLQPVCAWAAGFGSGVHMWVHSFTYALEQGIAWIPTGPWSYADQTRCPDQYHSPTGLSCYFKEATICPMSTGEPLKEVCAQWYNRHNGTTLVINAAKQLNTTREWVWGQLTSYMLQMKPDVAAAVNSRIPEKLKAGPSAAIQIRVVSAATGQDGMRVNLGVAAYLKHLEEKVVKANLTAPLKMVYVMSDDPSLSESSLNAQYPEYEFLRPEREWADVARGVANQNQSKSAVTYDLLADVFAAVQSEVFIGTASNLFWLIYALKQTKKQGPGINCWINTVEASPDFKKLFCPGDPGFYTYSPPGLRPSVEEEYVALLRDGLDRKKAWPKAIEVNHLRTKLGAML